MRKLILIIAILLLSSTAWGGANVGTYSSDLTAHYPLTTAYVDGSGFPTDISDSENDATSLAGGATITNDGMTFLGTDEHADIPTRTYDIDGGVVSFVFWANPIATGSGTQYLLTDSVSARPFIGWNASGGFSIRSNFATYDGAAASDGLSDNEWHMWTIVSTNGTITMWRDATSLTMSDDQIVSDNLTISRIGEGGSSAPFNNAQNLRVYEDRALTQADVTALYALGRNGLGVATLNPAYTTTINPGL